MTPSEWEQVKTLFEAALEVPPPERDAFIERHCAHATHLVDTLRCLVSAHLRSSSGLLASAPLLRASAAMFSEGDRIAGRYEVVRFIARGSYGEVYEVVDHVLDTHLALKVLQPERCQDRDQVARFKRELLVARQVVHPRLCRLFDWVEGEVPTAGTKVYGLTMELLEGQTLEALLAHSRPLSTQEAGEIIGQVAEAVDALHANGVSHRDLKPSNIILRSGSDRHDVVVTDFGMARLVDAGSFETRFEVQGGTPFFMAPEVLAGKKASTAADVYALALVLDEMVTTTSAFNAMALPALVCQKVWEEPLSLASRSSGLPVAWHRTVRLATARDPTVRPQTVAEFAALLFADRAPGPIRWPPIRNVWRRSWWAYAALAVALGAVSLGVGRAVAERGAAVSLSSLPAEVWVLPDEVGVARARAKGQPLSPRTVEAVRAIRGQLKARPGAWVAENAEVFHGRVPPFQRDGAPRGYRVSVFESASRVHVEVVDAFGQPVWMWASEPNEPSTSIADEAVNAIMEVHGRRPRPSRPAS